MQNHMERAKILSEALPHIQKYTGKTVVIKYGGNAMLSDSLKHAVMSDIILLSYIGVQVVVVHGGGPEINDMLSKVGKQSHFVNGLRYTDEETMEIVQMVLCGKIGKDLVRLIESMGGKAMGLCGFDGGLLQAEKHKAKADYGLVGDIVAVNPKPVQMALQHGYIPVVSTVAMGQNGNEVYNINADTAAAKLAVALSAENLILLTDVRGLLKDPKDENTLLSLVTLSEVPALTKQGVLSGGMIPKIDCCVEAIRQGVKRAHILDGRISHSILIEMLSDAGIGTMIVP